MTSTTLSDRFTHLSFDDSIAPHDPGTGTPLGRISIDRDTLTVDDHKELDNGTLNTFRSERKHNEEPDWPALLVNITAEDKRLITLTSKEAAACLDRNPGVLEVVKAAWEKQTFKEVRKLGMFSSPYCAYIVSSSLRDSLAIAGNVQSRSDFAPAVVPQR
jgi:hypothetical protein